MMPYLSCYLITWVISYQNFPFTHWWFYLIVCFLRKENLFSSCKDYSVLILPVLSTTLNQIPL